MSDPLFWPFLFVALIVAAFVIGFVKVVSVLARRVPGHHPQQAGDLGSNTYDASSRTSNTVNFRDVNIGNPRLPGFEG